MTKHPLQDKAESVWQPRAKRPLNAEDYRQMTENVAGFFSILREWRSQQAMHGEAH